MQLREAFNQFESALHDYGLGYTARLTTLKLASIILTKHEALGLTAIDRSIVAEHLNDADERLYANKLTKDSYHLIRRSVQRIVTFIEIGSVELAKPLKGQKFLLACSKEMALSSMYDVKLYMKKLYAFLLLLPRLHWPKLAG